MIVGLKSINECTWISGVKSNITRLSVVIEFYFFTYYRNIFNGSKCIRLLFVGSQCISLIKYMCKSFVTHHILLHLDQKIHNI